MKTRNVLNAVAHTLPDWHVGNDRQFGRITAYDPQARYEIIVNFPDRDTIRIVRIQYELVEDNTVLNTADMGEEQALSELSRLLASPMPRTDRLMWLKDQFDKTAEWWRNTIGGEQMAKDTDDMAERYMHVCENCNKYLEHDPVTVFKGWLCCVRSLAVRMRRAVRPHCTCWPTCGNWTGTKGLRWNIFRTKERWNCSAKTPTMNAAGSATDYTRRQRSIRTPASSMWANTAASTCTRLSVWSKKASKTREEKSMVTDDIKLIDPTRRGYHGILRKEVVNHA